VSFLALVGLFSLSFAVVVGAFLLWWKYILNQVKLDDV